MRRKIVAGNWKMNKTFQEAEELLNDLYEGLNESDALKCELVVCPPFTFLELAMDVADESDFSVGAQDVSKFDKGAYTGEVSAPMLKTMDVEYCIVGHSERRKYHNETDADVATKVESLLKNDIVPIVCCGEDLSIREAGTHLEYVKAQLVDALFGFEPLDFSKVVIAYEPIWAIGTGKTATPEQAQEMHENIRNAIAEKYGKEIAKNITILYGGSCTPQNATELFSQKDVDGGLIGGASLKADDFLKIAKSF
ncbi:triosephosphate isomerase [Bacteroidia bacterium]|nr:triosephosphate isomerase [Bacteroidia bacterium]